MKPNGIFRNPQRSLGNGGGKVIDFDAIKLTDGDLDGVQFDEAEGNLTALQQRQRFVFQPAQGEVGFRQKVTAAARRVEEFKRSQLVLELM